MRYRRLGSTGPAVSELGFGASPLGGIYDTFGEQDGIAAVHAAFDAGINFFDVSPYYGRPGTPALCARASSGLASVTST